MAQMGAPSKSQCWRCVTASFSKPSDQELKGRTVSTPHLSAGHFTSLHFLFKQPEAGMCRPALRGPEAGKVDTAC